jgi:twinkle protein
MENNSGFIKRNLSCNVCGGSDPAALNSNGSSYCFHCAKYYKKGENLKQEDQLNTDATIVDIQTFSAQKKETPIPLGNAYNRYPGQYNELTDRGISAKTAKAYGVKSKLNPDNSVSQHVYPYYENQEISGVKVRYVNNKSFVWHGSPNNNGLFGEHLFKKGGKYLTITEGECDAMAVYELFEGKWAVVSVKRGAAGAVKDIRENIEFVESFDNVVLCFDNDEAGREATKKVARILKPNKTKVVRLPEGYKDANEMLKAKKFREFSKVWWDAKTYTPSGILELSSKKDDWLFREVKDSVPYPFEGLNKKLFGLRRGELVTLTGGTGLGKSSVTRELEYWLIKTTKDNVGIIALEENWLRTADGIISIEANDRLYLNEKRSKYSNDELQALFDRTIQKDRVFIHSHLGVNDIEEFFSKLRYIIVGCECKWVVIDHLHMLVSVLTEGDERRGIDALMTRLRSIVEETGVGMILVSHLRRAVGDRGHEQGVEVSLSHLKGSQGIAQLSDCVIALERNQQATTEEEANVTRLRVLKSRYTGDTGIACYLKYNQETGRLFEYTPEELMDETSF